MNESCLYSGVVSHTRHEPITHGFSYRMMQPMLHLQALPDAFDGSLLWSASRPALAWFRRQDHYGPAEQPLHESIAELVKERTGNRPDGRIMLLTHPRTFGFVFNPVSFYYCYRGHDDALDSIVAQVDNTPWGERHMYVLRSDDGIDGHHFVFDKAFHVSPFMPMKQRYDWCFKDPGDELEVHMKSLEEDRPVFEARLSLRRQALTRSSLRSALAGFPLMTAKVFGAIYLQAAKLRIKQAPFFSHPKRGEHRA